MRYTVDLEAMHVELLSAVERNAQHPETFPIPSRAARESVEPGEIVKLLFCYTGDPEEDFCGTDVGVRRITGQTRQIRWLA